MTWFIRKGPENVKIYDALDSQGNGNIRFSGTMDGAIAAFAAAMHDGDLLRKRNAELETEVSQLKTQLIR